ncbi:MAG: D-amino acid aminotransferase [Methylococcales bacterium]|nr:D-amino acid aminotransferase [Methylococcales bacterium]
MSQVYLNGDYLPLHDAKIPVLDRGFLFGDGVYEVIPAYQGRLFRLTEHLHRLQQSLNGIRLANPHSHEQWRQLLEPLLSAGHDQSIYLQITRGVAAKRDHAFPAQVQPTVFAMASPITPYADKDHGVGAITLPDTRWGLCHIKAITLLANILLRQQAIDAGCAEALLLKNGTVTEGAASNVFIVDQGALITPPKSADILPGITRDLILEIAEREHLSYHEAKIPEPQLRAAEEIWVTSSTREILPIVTLDGVTVGEGRPGPLWQRMHTLFQAYKQHAS